MEMWRSHTPELSMAQSALGGPWFGGKGAPVIVSGMFAVTAATISPEDPLTALHLGDHPDPSPPDGWVTVTVKAASLNHHDVWTLRGVGISADRLPIVLGCDAAGVDGTGGEVVVHSVIGDALAAGGDETFDPKRSLLSERYDGTFAARVMVPQR